MAVVIRHPVKINRLLKVEEIQALLDKNQVNKTFAALNTEKKNSEKLLKVGQEMSLADSYRKMRATRATDRADCNVNLKLVSSLAVNKNLGALKNREVVKLNNVVHQANKTWTKIMMKKKTEVNEVNALQVVLVVTHRVARISGALNTEEKNKGK